MPYVATSWATIRARLADRYEGKVWWSGDDARTAFNEGLRLFNLLVARWKRRETLATGANQYLYTTSASMLARQRITIAGRPLSPSSLEDFNNGRPTWRSETTASGGSVPTVILLWAPVSLRTFYVWPADAVGGQTFTIDGVATTPTLTEDSDTLDLGEEQLTLLLDYALHALSFSQGATAFAASQALFRGFLAGCAEENGQIKSTQIYRRVMGLTHRDLKPLRGVPTQIDQALGAVTGGGPG
jgi:hypothetical protein